VIFQFQALAASVYAVEHLGLHQVLYFKAFEEAALNSRQSISRGTLISHGG
jgi:hypothetical protein